MPDPTLRERLLSSPAKPAGHFVLAASGETVYLRRWTLRDRMRVVAVSADKDKPALERVAEYLRLCLCDAENRRLFGDDDDGVSDVPLGPDEANDLITAALRANGMAAEDGGEKKTPSPGPSANSAATPNSDSSADSP